MNSRRLISTSKLTLEQYRLDPARAVSQESEISTHQLIHFWKRPKTESAAAHPLGHRRLCRLERVSWLFSSYPAAAFTSIGVCAGCALALRCFGSPAKPRSASAIFARPPAPVITTS